MNKPLLFLLFLLAYIPVHGQKSSLKPVSLLIDADNSGWKAVLAMVKDARNKVEVLPTDAAMGREAISAMQVSTKSALGGVLYNSAAILVDYGWVRILGAGSSKVKRSLPGWNKGKAFKDFGSKPGYIIIADDAAGGFFILNGGLFKEGIDKVYYFSPDDLSYELLDLTYTEFLSFCFNNNLDKFYENMRWVNWKDEVSALQVDKVYHFYPYLFSKEGKDINQDTRGIVPAQEQYEFEMEMRKKLGIHE